VFTVSFYSFKGGVGRTVTLLNAAWHLAQHGSRVALLDLDLEAPGLHSARLRRDGRSGWRPPEPRRGFSDLVKHFAGQKQIAEWPGDYLTQDLGPGGRIALLAARGEGDPSYLARYESFVQTFSWSLFYREMNGRGFMEGLVQGLADLGYDYLFIDARTGLTDVAGITLLHLPDLVVLVTNLSDQSIQGIRTQLAAIEEVNRECRADGEGSRKRRQDRRAMPISVVLVGSPLPRGELTARQARLRAVEELLGCPLDVQVDYLPLLALEEENHILAQKLEVGSDELLLGATRPYERLVQEILARNPAAPENLLAEGEELNQLGRWREALAHFDEVQDRYGDRQDPILWEARLHKVRSQLQALNAPAARQSLELLERDPHMRRWEDIAQVARGRLAASWTFIILNRFEDARDEAFRASRLLLERPSFRGRPEQQTLLAACRFFLGQASSLCGEWERACRALEASAKTYAELGTRPLLECLALAELARARLSTSKLSVAKEIIERAWVRAGLGDSSRGLERMQHWRAGRIASTYVQARLLQARAEVSCEQGQGPSALQDLHEAFENFNKEGDEVALVEVAVSLSTLALAPPTYKGCVEEPGLWKSWKSLADRLSMPRVSVRFDLLSSVRSFAVTPLPDPQPLLETDDRNGSLINALVHLENCRRLLSAGNGENETIALLEKAKEDLATATRPQREVEHELALLEALWEVRTGDLSGDGLRALRRHADDMRSKDFRLREAQARVVLALAESDSKAHPELRDSLKELDRPKRWYWNLPVAFVEHAPGFRDRWQRLEPFLKDFWARPTGVRCP
jgi:tetratricopeptide (TPR) repeat protein